MITSHNVYVCLLCVCVLDTEHEEANMRLLPINYSHRNEQK